MWATILLILKNLGALMDLIHMIKKTPQEQHEELLESLKAEAKSFNETGRPKWS